MTDEFQQLTHENELLADENAQLLSGEAWGEMIAQHKKLTVERDALITEVQELHRLVDTYGEAIARLAGEKETLACEVGRLSNVSTALLLSTAPLRAFVGAMDKARAVLCDSERQK